MKNKKCWVMKKSIISILAACAAVLGCNKEISQIEESIANGGNKENVTIIASIAQTKTTASINGEEAMYSWQSNETISVLEESASSPTAFTVSDVEAGAFSGTKTTGKDLLLAISPASALATASAAEGLSYTITLPGLYDNYVPGTTNAVMVGTPNGEEGGNYLFRFAHVAAIAKIVYENVPVGTLGLAFATDQNINGTFTGLTSASGVTLNVPASGSNETDLYLAEAVSTANQTLEFYVPLPAGTYTSFSVYLFDSNLNEISGTKRSKKNISLDLAAADMFVMPTITLEEVKDVVYELYSGDITEGSYLITYSNGAMNTTVESDRIQFVSIEPTGNNTVLNPSKNIIWTISKTGNYWTIYNDAAGQYAASTGAKNKAQLLGNGTDDKCLWTISGSSTYDFVNKANSANGVNAHLRKNGTYGFACYAESTGGSLNLYKLSYNWTLESIAITTPPTKMAYEAGEKFDSAGMEVTAHYVDADDNAHTKDVIITDYTVNPDGPLTTAISSVTISYGGKSATQNITVNVATGWIETAIGDLAADDIFVIVGNNDSDYAMSNDNGTDSAPAAVKVTVSGNKITSEVADNIKWNISGNANEGYIFYPNGSTTTWLYATNNGIRIGVDDNKTWKIIDSYLYHIGTERYIGVYSSQDWRCYTSINDNIKNQTFKFYRLIDPRDTAGMGWSSASAFATITNSGTSFTAPTLTTGNASNITYKSTAEEVATVNASGVIEIIAEGTTKIQAIFAGDANYRPATAEYILTVTDERTYSITVTQPAEGGTISANPNGAQKAGKEITLTANPDEGYVFDSWSVYKTGDVSSKVTVTADSFVMPAYPVTITASFTIKTTEKTLQTLYLESFGSTSSNTALSSYSGYSATTSMFATSGDVKSHYSGNGSVGKNSLSSTNLSSGYTGASGLSGCYHTGTANTEATIIQITGINIKDSEDISVSFGALGGSSSHKINVYYKIDDGAETALITNGSITNSEWTRLSESISGTGNTLTLIFKHTPTKAWTIRMDDITVVGKK